MKKPLTPVFVGIDPGSDGAVAVIDSECNVLLIADLEKDENTGATDAFALKSALALFAGRIAGFCIEQPTAFVKNSHAMLRLGMSFGVCCAIGQTSAPALIIYPTPRRWKSAMGLSADKDESTSLAFDAFMGLPKRMRHDKAEALLLALYCLTEYEQLERVEI
jgi:Holliday junction resolvasome RuvABC endonuclease subunit